MREGRGSRVAGEVLPPCLVALLLLVSPPPADRAGASAVPAVLPWGAVPAAAQSRSDMDPSLERVDALARAGSVEGAREELLRWYDDRGAAASREEQQRALWLRAALTVDPTQAALDLRRLTLEYPGGAWTPGALLRLGLLAEAGGRHAQAADRYQVLVRDYPASEAAATAGVRLERMFADPSSAGARASTSAPSRATAPPAATKPGGDPSVAAAPAGDLTVQLGAFGSRERALALVARAREAGLDVRLVTVPGSDLIRVRVGRFADAEAAMPVYERVVGRGFEAAVISGASREAPAG